jgi:hypothetical protein
MKLGKFVMQLNVKKLYVVKVIKSISIGTQVKIPNYTFVIKKKNQRKITLKAYEIMSIQKSLVRIWL